MKQSIPKLLTLLKGSHKVIAKIYRWQILLKAKLAIRKTKKQLKRAHLLNET